MSQLPFVHLRLHSEYSVTDGIVRLDDAVAAAVADGMPALALTDLANVFGMVKFYQAARARGVKPIIGCDVWIENEADRDKPLRLLLLVPVARRLPQSVRTADARLPHQPVSRPRRNRAWFAARGTDGLIALSGAHLGDVGLALLAGNRRHALKLAREWAALFPQRYYLELQRLRPPVSGSPLENACSNRCARRRTQLPVVATHPVQFLQPDDFRAHEARVCIAEGYVLGDQRRAQALSRRAVFQDAGRDGALFADIPEALANSVEIAKRCNLTLELGKSRLPAFPTPDNVEPGRLSGADTRRPAWQRRLAQLYPDAARARRQAAALPGSGWSSRSRPSSRWVSPGYFLIVADFINWAKQNGVPVGPGARLGRRFAGGVLRWASPTSIRCATTCCSSASSIPSACRCPTSTSTSARTGATA